VYLRLSGKATKPGAMPGTGLALRGRQPYPGDLMIPTDTVVGQYIQRLVLMVTRYLFPAIAATYVAGEFVGRFYFKGVRPAYARHIAPALKYAFTLN